MLNSVAHHFDQLNAAHPSFLLLADGLPGKIQNILQTDLNVSIIFYLGLCNGAGWATELDGNPVILLGVEKIIELSWQNKNWCEANRQKLYKVFLQRINHAESTHDFFGDWNHYEGRSDVGYYLGCEMIKKLSTRYSLLELANFEEADILEQLKSMAR